ncbi:unnamed protein product, partial [Medioppia subpectinata]
MKRKQSLNRKMSDDARAKFEDKERKKAEIRQRLEAQMKSTKKKGFMTPERKKRLRQLLRRKAADEVKRQQELKEKERLKVIGERTGTPKAAADANEGQCEWAAVTTLMAICKEYYNRIYRLNEDKWDLELVTCIKEYEVRGEGSGVGSEINDLQSRVNDMRGKFIIPPLKKVSKYQTQLEKMRQWTYKLAKMDLKGGLKPVKKEIDLGGTDAAKKPDWVAGKHREEKSIKEKDEKERKRAELRQRLEAEMKSAKKKGFMTPERKKKLRVGNQEVMLLSLWQQLLRKKAAEELKREQELKSIERKRIIEERTGVPKNVKEICEQSELIAICEEYHKRIVFLDEKKFDLEVETVGKEYEINELSAKVNDVRGRFIIPPLNKISKTATQLEKMRQWTMKLAKLDMKGSLKPVKKDISKELGARETDVNYFHRNRKMQTISEIIFDSKPILLRKTPEKDVHFLIEYKAEEDVLSVTKTETFGQKRPKLERWTTIRELLFAEHEEDVDGEERNSNGDKDYEEIEVLDESEDRSEESDEKSEIVSFVCDYFHVFNVFKVLAIVLCVNGFVLQSILLFSEPEMRFSREEDSLNSLAVCFRTQITANSTLREVLSHSPQTRCEREDSDAICGAKRKSLFENRFLCLHFEFENEIQIFADFSSNILLQIHSNGETADESAAKLELSLDSGLELRFWTLIAEQLEENCEQRVESRNECFQHCLRELLFIDCQCIPESGLNVHLFPEFENLAFCSKSNCFSENSFQKCLKKCPKNCEQNIHFLSTISDFFEPKNQTFLRIRRQRLAFPANRVQKRSSAELTALFGGLSSIMCCYITARESRLAFIQNTLNFKRKLVFMSFALFFAIFLTFSSLHSSAAELIPRWPWKAEEYATLVPALCLRNASQEQIRVCDPDALYRPELMNAFNAELLARERPEEAALMACGERPLVVGVAFAEQTLREETTIECEFRKRLWITCSTDGASRLATVETTSCSSLRAKEKSFGNISRKFARNASRRLHELYSRLLLESSLGREDSSAGLAPFIYCL